jgi:hypothetical protein
MSDLNEYINKRWAEIEANLPNDDEATQLSMTTEDLRNTIAIKDDCISRFDELLRIQKKFVLEG